jgi:hypothetical protein
MNTIMMDPGWCELNPEIVAEMTIRGEAGRPLAALAGQSTASLHAGRDFPYNREFHLRLT